MTSGINQQKIGGMMYLDDIKETIVVKKDEEWFIDYFEITIDELVKKFSDRIEDDYYFEDLPAELEMVVMNNEEDDNG